jgi:hypothetical protein
VTGSNLAIQRRNYALFQPRVAGGEEYRILGVFVCPGFNQDLHCLAPMHWTAGLVMCHPHGGLRTFYQNTSLPRAIDLKALCGANLVTLHSIIWGEQIPQSPSCGCDARDGMCAEQRQDCLGVLRITTERLQKYILAENGELCVKHSERDICAFQDCWPNRADLIEKAQKGSKFKRSDATKFTTRMLQHH